MHPDAPQPSRDRGSQTGCRARLLCFSCLLLPASCLLFTGCRGLGKPDKRYDLLEAELRTRERELLEARGELSRAGLLAQTYQRQNPGCAAPVGEPAFHGNGIPLQNITLASGTGGIDSDGEAGDEAFQVVVVPKDEDGSPVKVPGVMTVSAFEITREGLKKSIGRWEVPPEQLRKSWRAGLFSTGYFVPLQWDQIPCSDRVRVVVRFTSGGRDFEADKDVTVRPPGPTQPLEPGIVPVTPPSPSRPPPEVPELPPPKGLIPATPSSLEELPPPGARLGTPMPSKD